MNDWYILPNGNIKHLTYDMVSKTIKACAVRFGLDPNVIDDDPPPVQPDEHVRRESRQHHGRPPGPRSPLPGGRQQHMDADVTGLDEDARRALRPQAVSGTGARSTLMPR